MANVTMDSHFGTRVVNAQPGTSAPEGAAPAWNGGADWQGATRCSANWGECGAPRMKTGELCVGHQRSLDKHNRELAGE